MIIYGSVVSPFVRKLLGYLGEKGIEFELQGVGIGDPDPGFRAAAHGPDQRHRRNLRVRVGASSRWSRTTRSC